MRTFCGSSNWLTARSPTPLGASNCQSCGSHTRSAPGAQAHSCGPEVVLRAAYSLPPDAAIRGKALSAGSRSTDFRVVTEDLPAYAAALGVAVAQLEGRPASGGCGSLLVERMMPPLFAM